MKISKALKMKNQVAGEIALLKQRLAEQNVRPEGQEFDYNNGQVLAELRGKLGELVRVKTALAQANTAVYAGIFRLAELKGLLAALRGLDTKQGEFREGRLFSEEANKVRYRAQLNKAEVDRLAAELEVEITDLQDRLDEFNATHEVVLSG
jgi:hypothetical protein